MKRKFSSLFPESVFSRGFPKEILIYLKNRCLQLSYPASDSCLTSSPVPRGLGLVHSFLPCTKSRPFAQGIFFFFFVPLHSFKCLYFAYYWASSSFASTVYNPRLTCFSFSFKDGRKLPISGKIFFFLVTDNTVHHQIVSCRNSLLGRANVRASCWVWSRVLRLVTN